MADLIFPDVSNDQPNVDFGALRAYTPAVACQINWGTNVTISQTPGRIAAIRAQGFGLVIWYMGLMATQDLESQVNAFTDTLGPLLPNEAVCIDWEETPGYGTPTPVQRDAAASDIGADYGISRWLVGTYGPAGALSSAPPASWVWAASYETHEPTIPHELWQFTDGQYVSPPYSPVDFPGIGYCDASVFHGSVQQLASVICPPKPVPAPSTSPEVYMIPSNCTDQGAVLAQIREWWTTYRSDPMTAEGQEIFQAFFSMPVTTAWLGKNGYGGSPDLLLAGIIDTAGTNLRPQYAGAV